MCLSRHVQEVNQQENLMSELEMVLIEVREIIIEIASSLDEGSTSYQVALGMFIGEIFSQ